MRETAPQALSLGRCGCVTRTAEKQSVNPCRPVTRSRWRGIGRRGSLPETTLFGAIGVLRVAGATTQATNSVPGAGRINVAIGTGDGIGSLSHNENGE